MLTWNAYYHETMRRENEIAQAEQDRFIKTVVGACQSPMTSLSIQMLEKLGNKLVQWGNQLQCHCAELAMTRSNRSI